MTRAPLAPGTATLSQAKRVLELGSLGSSDVAQCLIHIQTAIETLFRAYISSMRHVPGNIRRRAGQFHEMSFPELVEAMTEHGRPPLEEGDELLELNRFRIQAAHPSEGAVSVDVTYLDSIVELTQGMYDTYADSIQKGWRNAVDSAHDSLWVEMESRSLKAFPSTRERRLVWIKHGSPVKVLLVGSHFPSPFGADRIAYVRMIPRRVKIEFAEDVLTRDRVPVDGEAVLELVIIDEETAIKKMVLNSAEEERLAKDSFVACLQLAAGLFTYDEMLRDQAKFVDHLTSQLGKRLQANASSLRVEDVFLLRLAAADEEIAKAALQRAQAEERSATELVLLSRVREKQQLEAEVEKEHVQHQHMIEGERVEREIEVSRKRQEILRLELQNEALRDQEQRNLELEKAKVEAQIRIEEAIAKAAAAEKLDSDEAKLSFYPKEWWQARLLELEIKKYKVQQEFELQKRQLGAHAAFTEGQADALKAVLSTQQQLTLREAPYALPEAAPDPPDENWEAQINKEYRQLSELGRTRWLGNSIRVELDSGDALEIFLSASRVPPSVYRLHGEERLEVDMSWWAPSTTLPDIVRRLTGSTEEDGNR